MPSDAAASFLKPPCVDSAAPCAWLLGRGWRAAGGDESQASFETRVSRGPPFELPFPVSVLDSTVCWSFYENQTYVIFGFYAVPLSLEKQSKMKVDPEKGPLSHALFQIIALLFLH